MLIEERDNKPEDKKEPPFATRRLIFTTAFGVVLILWAIAAGYHASSLLRSDNLIMDNPGPPAYVGIVFLGGLFCIVFVALSIAGRALRLLLRHLRQAQAGDSDT